MKRVTIVQGDITEMKVGAIVNAANTALAGGGGVDGAIHRKGGPSILAACQEIVSRQGHCPTGEAVITTAGELPASHVIHAVGPVWQGGDQNEHQLLRLAYRNSLRLAETHRLASIAFPNISTGIFGFPKNLAAEVVFAELAAFTQRPSCVEEVYLVCYDDENFGLYLNENRRMADQGLGDSQNKPSAWRSNFVVL